MAKNTAAVVFLATPHAGSNEADFMKRLNSIFKVVRHTETIDELTFQNANLRNLDQWYSKYADANGISTLAFYEKNETFGHLIVDEGSANPHTRGSKDELVPVGANHLEISKPPNKEHIVYETTVRFLKSVLNYVAVERRRVPIDINYFPSINDFDDLPNLNEDDLMEGPESVVFKYENASDQDLELLIFDCSRHFLEPNNHYSAWVLIPFKCSRNLLREHAEPSNRYRHYFGKRTTGQAILVVRSASQGSGPKPEILTQRSIDLASCDGVRFRFSMVRSNCKLEVLKDDF